MNLPARLTFLGFLLVLFSLSLFLINERVKSDLCTELGGIYYWPKLKCFSLQYLIEELENERPYVDPESP